jgi:hypothetical protein
MSVSARKSSPSRRLAVERLEGRELMSADVSAYVLNGALFVGESAGAPGGQNGVQVAQVAPGTMRVTGLQTDDGGMSLVNGHASQDFAGVTSLFVNLGGGNDRVYVGSSSSTTAFSGDVFVNTDGSHVFNVYGADYDHVIVQHVTTTGTVDIRTGPGNDYVAVGDSAIGNDDLDNLNVHAGGGSDTVILGNVDVAGNLAVFTSDATGTATNDDQVSLQTVTAHNGLLVQTGIGKDTLTATDVTSTSDILFNLGAGNDTASLNSVRAGGDFNVTMGAGNDTLAVTYLRANRLTLDGGAGRDALTTGQGGTVGLLSEPHWELINGQPPHHFHPF